MMAASSTVPSKVPLSRCPARSRLEREAEPAPELSGVCDGSPYARDGRTQRYPLLDPLPLPMPSAFLLSRSGGRRRDDAVPEDTRRIDDACATSTTTAPALRGVAGCVGAVQESSKRSLTSVSTIVASASCTRHNRHCGSPAVLSRTTSANR